VAPIPGRVEETWAAAPEAMTASAMTVAPRIRDPRCTHNFISEPPGCAGPRPEEARFQIKARTN
jgi:hypothetical protein